MPRIPQTAATMAFVVICYLLSLWIKMHAVLHRIFLPDLPHSPICSRGWERPRPQTGVLVEVGCYVHTTNDKFAGTITAADYRRWKENEVGLLAVPQHAVGAPWRWG